MSQNEQQMTGSHIGRAVSFTTLATWVSKIGQIAAALVVFRLFSPDQFGVWRFIVATYGFVQGWISSPVALIVVEAIRDRGQELTAGRFEGQKAFRGYIKIVLVTAFCLVCIATLLSWPLVEWLSIRRHDLFLFGMGIFSLGIIRMIVNMWVQLTYSFRVALRMQLVESLSYPLFILFFVLFLRLDLAGIALSVAASSLLALSVSSSLVRDVWRDLWKSTFAEERKVLSVIFFKHGKWAIANDIAKDVLDYLRIFIIRLFFGDAGVGMFSLTDALLGHTTSLINLGQPISSAIPRLLHDPEALKRTLKDTVKFGTITYAAAVLLSWIGLPFLPWIFPKYAPAGTIYFFVSFVIFFSGLNTMMNALFPALRWQRSLFVFTVIRILLLCMIYPLISSLGMVPTIAIDIVAGSLLFTGLRYIWLRRYFQSLPLSRDLFLLERQDFARMGRLILGKRMAFFKKVD